MSLLLVPLVLMHMLAVLAGVIMFMNTDPSVAVLMNMLMNMLVGMGVGMLMAVFFPIMGMSMSVGM